MSDRSAERDAAASLTRLRGEAEQLHAELRDGFPHDDDGFVGVTYHDGRSEAPSCPWCKRTRAQGHWEECEFVSISQALRLAEMYRDLLSRETQARERVLEYVQHKPECAVLNPAAFDPRRHRNEPPPYITAKSCTCGLSQLRADLSRGEQEQKKVLPSRTGTDRADTTEPSHRVEGTGPQVHGQGQS